MILDVDFRRWVATERQRRGCTWAWMSWAETYAPRDPDYDDNALELGYTYANASRHAPGNTYALSP